MSSVTGPIDVNQTQTLAGLEAPAHERDAVARFSLLIQHGGGIEIATLHPGAPLVLGRAPARGRRIEHSTLSREHARFELLGDHVIVDDLGSKNGVLFGDQRVRRALLEVGSSVMLGAVRVQVQALGLARPSSPELDDGVVGAHMRGLLVEIERLGSCRLPVILHGETGTGKEVLARLIHERGPRKDRRLVRVNCGAIPKDLVESTLFGHERGAFTGALQQHKGIFEEADGGTVFLDEIAELPLPAQAALLRVLETGSFCRVGSAREVTVDVRVVAATHRDLEEMARAGAFRADLYYRLGGAMLEIAPLRERAADIEPLALHFLRLANRANGRAVLGIDDGALAVLRGYGWPGNVRELRNAIERAVVVCRGVRIEAGDLPLRLREGGSGSGAAARSAAPAAPLEETGSSEHKRAREPVREEVRQYEAHKLRTALEEAGWNRSEAARRLDMPVRTLSYRMKVLGLTKPV